MSFSRVNALGWGLYEELSSGQMNALDIDHANALDTAADDSIGSTVAITWLGTNLPRLTSRTYSRVIFPHYSGRSDFSAAGTDWSTAANAGYITQGYVDTTGTPNIPLVFIPIPRLIDLATIIAVKCRAKGQAGHSNPPATMPKVELIYTLDGAQTIVATGTDPSGTATAYQLTHDVNISAISHAVDASNRRGYALRWYGEGGTNATTGLQLYEITIDYTVTLDTPGG